MRVLAMQALEIIIIAFLFLTLKSLQHYKSPGPPPPQKKTLSPHVLNQQQTPSTKTQTSKSVRTVLKIWK